MFLWMRRRAVCLRLVAAGSTRTNQGGGCTINAGKGHAAMYLVVGATGFLGGEICRRLVGKDARVRALVRSTSAREKVRYLERLGAELVEGDLKDRASLDAACRGATAVISTATTTVSRQPGDTIERVDRDGQLDLVDAAQAAGARHFVFVSVGSRMLPCPLTEAKRAVERRLQESGLTYTVLRPTAFMEIWLGPALGFDIAGGRVHVLGPGTGKLSWIALGDVAQFAVESLSNPEARNATVELGGPEALSPLEVVRICEDVTGKQLEVHHVPDGAPPPLPMPDDSLRASFEAIVRSIINGDPIDMSETLGRFPIRLTSVRDYAERVAGGAAPAANPKS
jgi:NADH dehydrogenase